MFHISRIILGIHTFLRNNYKIQIDHLFGTAGLLFDSLGAYCFGEASLCQIQPILREFVDKTNRIRIKEFKYIVDYTNWICEDLFRFLNEKELFIKDKNINSDIIKGDTDLIKARFFMWQIGKILLNIMDISHKKEIPILLQSFVALDEIFDSLGKWVFGSSGTAEIKKLIDNFEKNLLYKHNRYLIKA